MSYIFDANKDTPEGVARKRKIAEMLAGGATRAPQNVGEGLQAVGNAIMYRRMMGDAAEAEKAGLESASNAWNSAFGGGATPDNNAIMGVLSNPYLSDAQRQIAGALMQDNMRRQDPAYQLDMDMKRAQLDKLRNPPPPEGFTLGEGQTRFDAQGNPVAQGSPSAKAPTVQSFYDGEGREYKAQWNDTTKAWEPVGGPKADRSGGLSVTLADGTTIQQGTFDKQDSKNVANRITEEQEVAAAGSSLKQTVAMLREASKNVGYSGPGAGIYGGIDNALEGMGLGSLPGNSADRAVLTSGGLDVALAQVQKTKGAISNAEMALFMAAAPGLQNTPQGNAALLDMIDAVAERQVQRATEMERYRQQHGGTLDGFERQWADYIDKNPLIVRDGGGVRLNAGPRRAQGTVDDIDKLLEIYGD